MTDINNKSHNLDFKDLVDEYYTPLFRFGYSLSKSEDAAGDLTQQTFYIWAKKGDTLRDASKVKSWLFTTLYREFLRIKRKEGTTTTFEPEIMELELPVVESNIVTVLDANDTVKCLQEVDEIYRVPLTLYYLNELAYKEIAAALDLPIGTVMSRLSRGKSQLKSIILEKERNKNEIKTSNL